jgi:plasmid maintenance system antidote protein VapI
MSTPLERLRVLRDLHVRKKTIDEIVQALTSSGYTSLDEQAKALGLHRATAWTIVKNKHKLGRLSTKTIVRMIENPDTPPDVLAVIQKYVSEKVGDSD